MEDVPFWAVALAVIGAMNVLVFCVAWLVDAADKWNENRKEKQQ